MFSDGEISGFLDFDLSEINIRLWDPSYCATEILSESAPETYEIWFDILTGILQGYNNESPLTPEEKQSIFFVLCSIQVICVAFFGSRDEYKELAKINCKMMQWMIQNQTRISSIFQCI